MSFQGMDPLAFTDAGGQERAERIVAGALTAPPPVISFHDLSRLALCEVCDAHLTHSQIQRGARCCGGRCRAKAFEARNPRLYAASIEQLEGELIKRLGKAAGRAEDKAVTVRTLTRNVRVLKLTWMKLRSMTPSGKTFIQVLEELVHEAWLGRETP